MKATITEELLNQTFDACKEVMRVKIEKHGREAFSSKHECFGKIAEEVDELLQELRNDDQTEGFESELLDVAIAAVFSAASIKLRKSLDK